eukprot:TRINITY_DN77_c0_g1_i1.p1 TRINITY_DN77_c0_g1~~TRINITY_DN77_c0_g1_i1.p1  ORF type:complete len:413 (+),score=74.55 TRINITY_DN77_c0_g1_i1:110-1348(+)
MSDLLADEKVRDSSESEEETEEKPGESYVHINGDWEDRKISLFGVVKGFIGQLRLGEDLTKVSMPVVFCRPYSLLEEVGARNFVHFNILFKLEQKKDPAERLLSVIEWLISTARQEKFHHKPLNPVIGEVNTCHFKHDKKGKDVTYLVTEQVRHHPPICGIRIDNPHRKISLEGFYSFEIQFNRNSVSVTNNGPITLKCGDEEYILKKAMPDLMIRNVILGSKLVSWEGGLTIECKQTGCSGKFDLTTKSRTNHAKGGVYTPESADEPLIIVEGKCGGPATYHFNPKHPKYAKEIEGMGRKEKNAFKKKLEEKQVLAGEPGTREEIIPAYPPTSKQSENSSYRTWETVRKCILDNDMDNGDLAKQEIEKKQRSLLAALKEKGEKYKPHFFSWDEETQRWFVPNAKWYKDVEW